MKQNLVIFCAVFAVILANIWFDFWWANVLLDWPRWKIDATTATIFLSTLAQFAAITAFLIRRFDT